MEAEPGQHSEDEAGLPWEASQDIDPVLLPAES